MGSRTFEHPLHRHPAVAPVLQLIDAAPAEDSLGSGYKQANVVKLRRLVDVERWATARFGLPEAPGYARRLSDECDADDLVALPAALAAVHRADEHDAELTETGRLVAEHGPSAARAWLASAPAPSLSARRLANQGWWPAVEPVFVGRLDDIRLDAYHPSAPLASGLSARRRWAEAEGVAARLPKRLRLDASKAIVRQKATAGVAPGALPPVLLDEYLWQSARVAADDGQNLLAALALVGDMTDARRRAMAYHEVHVRLGQLEPMRVPLGAPEARAGDDVIEGGPALMMHADAEVGAARPSNAWHWLMIAATAPRRDGRFWLDGDRPDLRLAQQMLFVSLKFGYAGRWPWGGRRLRALLDRYDAVRPVVDRLAAHQVEEALDGGAIRASWLKARVRQALFIRSLQRIDTADIDRRLHRAPEAEAFLRGLMGDRAFGDTLSRDPVDPIRAFYDDGLARSVRAARRRRSGLLQAARRTLRAGLEGSERAMRAAEIRLGTMAQLGGDRARRTLVHQVSHTHSSHPLHALMIGALVRIDGQGVLPRLFASPEQFGNRFDARAVHEALEAEALIPRGFASATRALRKAVIAAHPADADPWWFTLCEHWWTLHRAPPSEGILRWLAIQPPEVLARGPVATLERFEARRRALMRTDQDGLLTRLARDPQALSDLVLSTPFGDAYGAR